jgi:hypothetical protein
MSGEPTLPAISRSHGISVKFPITLIRTFVNLRMFASSLSAGFGRVRKRGFLRIIPAHSTTRSPPLPRIEPHRPER